MDAKVNSATSTNEFVISRVFDASRDRVWRTWTEREQLIKWFGPQGYTMSQATLDLRPDGIFHYALRASTVKRYGASGLSAKSPPPNVW